MNTTPVKIYCENTQSPIMINWGTPLGDIIKMMPVREGYPYMAAYVNNDLKSLDFRIIDPVTIRFIDITHFEGIRLYHRTLFLTLQKAVHDLWPDRRLRIPNSVSKGFYCEIDGFESISQEQTDRLKGRMQELIAQDLPIVRSKVSSEEAKQMYLRLGYRDKITLLETRPRLYVTIYSLADIVGYFYGVLAPSTGYLHLFDLKPYYNGLYIAVPNRSAPDQLEEMSGQDKMFEVFKEHKEWGDIIGVSNIGSLNRRVIGGEASDLIKVAEALHEKKVASIADIISISTTLYGSKLVLIAGPSSSGKTTFAKRLSIQLRILGLDPVMISLDDYFVDRDKTPVDERGEHDFETIDALDLETFNDNMNALFNGQSVDIPRYDFITGKRQWHETPLKLSHNSILLIEGIHGLNPRLTEHIDESKKFRIYISALTSISMDNLSRIPTTDNRLLRRIVRDNATRGHDALATLRRWQSVRAGEDRNIFPYQENADIMFNSSLFYEIPVLRKFVEPLLYAVPETEPEYGEAQRLLKFLNNFLVIKSDEIPPTSLLREFIGGSSFHY